MDWSYSQKRIKSNNIARQALDHHPQGKRKRRRPRNNWRRSMLQELEGVGYDWERANTVAKNRVQWRILVNALYASLPQ